MHIGFLDLELIYINRDLYDIVTALQWPTNLHLCNIFSMVEKLKTIQRNFKFVGLLFQTCSLCTVATILTFSGYFIIQSSISQNNILRKLDIEDSARFSTKISHGVNIDSSYFDFKNQSFKKYQVTFSDFHWFSIDAIDVTSVTLSRLNSINSIDVKMTRCTTR